MFWMVWPGWGSEVVVEQTEDPIVIIDYHRSNLFLSVINTFLVLFIHADPREHILFPESFGVWVRILYSFIPRFNANVFCLGIWERGPWHRGPILFMGYRPMSSMFIIISPIWDIFYAMCGICRQFHVHYYYYVIQVVSCPLLLLLHPGSPM